MSTNWFVYVLGGVGERGSGLYKIGMSRCLSKRMGMIEPKLPFDTELTCVFEGTPQAVKDGERHIHSALRSRRLRGEWFYLENDDVDWLREKVPNIGLRLVECDWLRRQNK